MAMEVFLSQLKSVGPALLKKVFVSWLYKHLAKHLTWLLPLLVVPMLAYWMGEEIHSQYRFPWWAIASLFAVFSIPTSIVIVNWFEAWFPLRSYREDAFEKCIWQWMWETDKDQKPYIRRLEVVCPVDSTPLLIEKHLDSGVRLFRCPDCRRLQTSRSEEIVSSLIQGRRKSGRWKNNRRRTQILRWKATEEYELRLANAARQAEARAVG